MIVVTYIVTGIVLLFIAYALFTGMWKVSKYLVIPMQILIFLALLFIIARIFFTSDNIKKLNHEIKKSRIVETQQEMMKQIIDANGSSASEVSGNTTAVDASSTSSAPSKVMREVESNPAPQASPQKPEDSKPAAKKAVNPIDLLD